jgi:hypothetical protein
VRLRQAIKIYKRVWSTDKRFCPYKISTMQEAECTLLRAWKSRRVQTGPGTRRFSITWEYTMAVRLTGFWRPYRALRKSLRSSGEWQAYLAGGKPWEKGK